MAYFDQLEETVGADDLTGRNNCPEWIRLSAPRPFEQRVIVQNGVRQDHEKPKGRGRGYKAIKCWVIVDGKMEVFGQISHLARIVGLSQVALSKRRMRAIASGKDDNLANGYRWGWTFKEVDDA